MLISGGDPLTLSDERLDYLLGRLRGIQHVEFVRLGTKVPVVLPMRITRSLIRVLKKHHPLWMSLHFTHPAELSPEVTEAVTRLADAGIPLGSQTVLLKDINDSVDTLKTLYHGLLMRRVRPYYLYQCDPITGSSHFRTSIDKGLEIMQGLRGHTTGYAVPTYVIDAPGGGGKIPLLPDYVVGPRGRRPDPPELRGQHLPLQRSARDGRRGPAARPRGRLMRIALVYDLRDDYRALGFSEEAVAEFDTVDTIDQLAGALASARLHGRPGRPGPGARRAVRGGRALRPRVLHRRRGERPRPRGAGAGAVRAVRSALSVLRPADAGRLPRQGGGQAARPRCGRADAGLRRGRAQR